MSDALTFISVPVVMGDHEELSPECVYNVDNFPYEDLPNITFARGWKRETAENIFLTFDIESTTMKSAGADPYGFMYHWQLDVYYSGKHHVVFGRRWEEFTTFRNRFYYEYSRRGMIYSTIMVYVHNLSFEFVFMNRFLDPESEIFARGANDVLVIREPSINWEWRCSYALTNMSLRKACEHAPNCIHRKLQEGSFDYKEIRTADTVLNEIEQGYCYNDVAGLAEVIADYHRHDRFIQMPLTSTAFVRRDMRSACRKAKSYHKKFQEMEYSAEQYKMMENGFRGGDTHASRYMADRIHYGIRCRDFASAYPAVMMQETFPAGPPIWCKIETQEQMDYYTSNFHVIMEVFYWDLQTSAPDPYIPVAKTLQRHHVAIDNGRVLSADFVHLVITEIDYQIIKAEYQYSTMKVIKSFYFNKELLPAPIRETVLKYYDGKTQLKGLPEKSYEYNKSKALLNSCYGCAATKIHDYELLFTGTEWLEKPKDLEDAIHKYFNSRNNVLPYQWALYVTAHVRKRLHDLIRIAGPDHFLYCDTDSIYYINDGTLEDTFEQWNNDLIARTSHMDMRVWSDDSKGKRRYLGIAEVDKDLDEFKTLGAKKYIYKDAKGTHITVAGLSKKAASYFKDDLNNFHVGVTVPEGTSGRTIAYRSYEDPHYITVDGCRMLTAGGIGIVDTTYTLGMTLEYTNLLGLSNPEVLQ